ncbi:MAG: hypothetical protein RL068_51 [Actinomycetota bacterium]|jgi:uncharacterized membrane protein
MIWTVLAASLAVYSWKILGYLVPSSLVTPAFRAFAERVTIVLLSGLVAVQTFVTGGELVIDARFAAVLLAAVLFALRVPYLVVVLAAGATAAVIRMFLGF